MRQYRVVAALVLLWAVEARADLTIDTVTVGNAGNVGEWSGASYGGYGPDRLCGAVDYTYDIGRYEVSTAEYAKFLNAVAATDTHDLYNPEMWSGIFGCKIERTGTPGSYTYSVASEWANRPVNCISWGDAARFSNWLHNGQPGGDQDLSTTEDGSYFLDGATSIAELMDVTRAPDATWVIPTEDEWYKAAYHRNDGVTGNFFDYPTSSDVVPSNDLADPDPGNNVNCYNRGLTISAPYFRTEVGEFENSQSAYGTYDQGGNVWEWNEQKVNSTTRSVRGGAFYDGPDKLRASVRLERAPTYELAAMGFRVALVPEPATLALLFAGGVTVFGGRRGTGRSGRSRSEP